MKIGGAITILNAIKYGYGATIGIDEKFSIKLEKSNKLRIHIKEQNTDDRLIRECIALFEKKYKKRVNLEITSYTNLPPARGLKTSSGISCSLMVQLHEYYNLSYDPHIISKMSAKASINAEVSLTGAIDDAYGCILGGLVYTNNKENLLISNTSIPDFLKKKDLFLLIPLLDNPKFSVKNLIDRVDLELVKKAKEAFDEGNILQAIKYNTNAYGKVLVDDYQKIKNILDEYNFVYGLNGTGPSFFIIGTNINDIMENLITLSSKYKLVKSSFRDLNQ